ncbi:MAG: hypothetical protein ACM3PZ_00215 [Bacillota bacterium]
MFFKLIQSVSAANLKDAFDTSANKPLSTVAEKGAGFLPGISLETQAGNIITAILSLLGILFVVYGVYGGFVFMMASGNPEKTKHGVAIITQALTGMIIILAAYAISYFIIKIIT